MKGLTRYDALILLFLSFLCLSLLSRATALEQKEERTEDYTLLVVFEDAVPSPDTPLFLYGHPIGLPRFLSEERAHLLVRGVRLSGGFFLHGERWLGANLPLTLSDGERTYRARLLTLFESSDVF